MVSSRAMMWMGAPVLAVTILTVVVSHPLGLTKPAAVLAAITENDSAQVVGPDSCSECHEQEHKVWMDTAHQADAKILSRNSEAKRIAKAMGVRRIKADDRCISCHYTPQQRDGGRLRAISGVSCESCHGPAANWIDRHADFGQGAATAADESPMHRADRLRYCESMGMNRPERLYDLASSCFACHAIYDDALVQDAGHPAGEEFEFASWSQGGIRHNFLRAGSEKNPQSKTARVRVMYVVGAALRLEFACRAVAEGAPLEHVASAIEPLREISLSTALPEAAELIKIGESVIDAQTANSATNRVREIGLRIAKERIGAESEHIDALLPEPRKGRSE